MESFSLKTVQKYACHFESTSGIIPLFQYLLILRLLDDLGTVLTPYSSFQAMEAII